MARLFFKGEEIKLGNPVVRNDDLKGKRVNGLELDALKKNHAKIKALEVTEPEDDTYYFLITEC